MGEEDIAVLRVSGRMDAEHVDTLSELLEQEKGKGAIDLTEVTLINRLLEALIAAAQKGDVAALEGLFAEDVVSCSDGGGIVRAEGSQFLAASM